MPERDSNPCSSGLVASALSTTLWPLLIAIFTYRNVLMTLWIFIVTLFVITCYVVMTYCDQLFCWVFMATYFMTYLDSFLQMTSCEFVTISNGDLMWKRFMITSCDDCLWWLCDIFTTFVTIFRVHILWPLFVFTFCDYFLVWFCDWLVVANFVATSYDNLSWKRFVITFYDDILWQHFVASFCDNILWPVFVTTFCSQFLWQHFVASFCDNILKGLFVMTFCDNSWGNLLCCLRRSDGIIALVVTNLFALCSKSDTDSNPTWSDHLPSRNNL